MNKSPINHTGDKNDPQIDASKCPLCGGPNLCPMVADPDASECWCGDKEFPRELLAQIPKGAKRKACICQKCLENYQKSADILILPK
jgi:hypothetical protein